MLHFFLILIWFWLLIVIFTDISRNPDTSDVAKAFWVILVVGPPRSRSRRVPDRPGQGALGRRRHQPGRIRRAEAQSAKHLTPPDCLPSATPQSSKLPFGLRSSHVRTTGMLCPQGNK
jgi:hypothetical protein